LSPSIIKYGDVSKVESDFVHAPVGVYVAKVKKIEQKLSKNKEDMVEVIFTLTKDAKGKKLTKAYSDLYFYAPIDPTASWARRLKDLVTAFGLKAKGGNLGAIEGKEAMVRLREDTDLDGEYRPNIGKVFPLAVAKDDDEDEEDVDTEEEEDDAEDEEEDEDDLDGLSRAELKALIKEEGLEVKVLKSMSDDDVREAITEARPDDEEEDEEDEEDEDEEDDEEEEEDDQYDTLSLADLRAELKERQLDTKGKKAILVARLRTDDAEDPV